MRDCVPKQNGTFHGYGYVKVVMVICTFVNRRAGDEIVASARRQWAGGSITREAPERTTADTGEEHR